MKNKKTKSSRSFLAASCLLALSIASPAFAVDITGVADANAAPAIRVAPRAPVFTDAERQSELAARRKKVADKIGKNSVLMLMSAEPKIYTNDVEYEYRQENNLYYLTMLKQRGATLVILPGNTPSEILFVPKRDARNETWNGKMYGFDDVRRVSGVQTVLDAKELPAFVAALKARQSFLSVDKSVSTAGFVETSSKSSASSPINFYLMQPVTPDDQEGLREYPREAKFAEEIGKEQPAYRLQNAQFLFGDFRLIKSPMEQKILQHSIDITTEAFGRAMAVAGRSNYEYEVEAEVEYTFRRRNADYWGYPSIVGCGPNATTLHYVESQGKINQGELLLMDVGAEYDHYTADVTRTFPISGKFTKEQAEVYQIVYDAQEAAAAAIKPGASHKAINDASLKIQREGLVRLGLIPSVDSPYARLWTLHGISHWLGMNVHDAGSYAATFKPGMIFTNEPGIYVREDALDNLEKTAENEKFIAFARPAFEKYKNIGVRIEDDMLVTETGAEWMTKNLPRKIADIEAMIAKASKELPVSANRQRENTPFAALLDANANLLLSSGSGNFDDLLGQTLTNGKTVRRGWVTGGKHAARTGLDHAHAE